MSGRYLKPVVALVVVASLGTIALVTRGHWWPLLVPGSPGTQESGDDESAIVPMDRVLLSEQAQKNLQLKVGPIKVGTYWRTRQIPGMIIDRPGISDRGIVAPATGVITRIEHVAGHTVRPGDPLFTIKLLSESLHLTQAELFKATQEVKLIEEQKKRLASAGGVVSESRLIEIESQLSRWQASRKAYTQELLTRGITATQVAGIQEGNFVSEMTILVPHRPGDSTFELQELRVDLGQQVQAGQTLCLISNHQRLAIEGQAFLDEAPLIERSLRENWPIEVDFAEADTKDWPAITTQYSIAYVANTIDPGSRTFRFMSWLENQSRLIERDGRAQLLWRFRPGQRARLKVRVEEVPNVLVVPKEAIAFEGANAFVFRQNGDTYEKRPVQVLEQTRDVVVLANDGSVPPGTYIALNAANQIHRMTKSSSNGLPPGAHMHADGSIHYGKH